MRLSAVWIKHGHKCFVCAFAGNVQTWHRADSVTTKSSFSQAPQEGPQVLPIAAAEKGQLIVGSRSQSSPIKSSTSYCIGRELLLPPQTRNDIFAYLCRSHAQRMPSGSATVPRIAGTPAPRRLSTSSGVAHHQLPLALSAFEMKYEGGQKSQFHCFS